MRFFLFFLIACLANAAAPVYAAESISAAADRIATARDKKEGLEKLNVKAGDKIQDIGSLTIEDFLELQAVPDGMDAVSAQTLYDADNRFDFFLTTEQALQSIAVMRGQGIELPADLEKNIKQDPANASKLMDEAFQKIPPAKVESKEDIARVRRSAIKEAETTLGIRFKDILENQKQMMSPAAKQKKRGRIVK